MINPKVIPSGQIKAATNRAATVRERSSIRILALAASATLLLAACGEKEARTDFNYIIPKIMGLNGPKPVDAAAALFDTTSPDERRDAIAFLCKQKYGHEPPYMKAYTMLATDPHPMVRAQSMKALGGARTPTVVPALLKGLEDKDPMVRQDASAALVESFTDEAIEPLIKHLKDDDDVQTRINAARALVNTRDPRGLRGLIDALDDRNAGVIFYAHDSLRRVTGQPIAAESRQWLEWYQSQAWAKTQG